MCETAFVFVFFLLFCTLDPACAVVQCTDVYLHLFVRMVSSEKHVQHTSYIQTVKPEIDIIFIFNKIICKCSDITIHRIIYGSLAVRCGVLAHKCNFWLCSPPFYLIFSRFFKGPNGCM